MFSNSEAYLVLGIGIVAGVLIGLRLKVLPDATVPEVLTERCDICGGWGRVIAGGNELLGIPERLVNCPACTEPTPAVTRNGHQH